MSKVEKAAGEPTSTPADNGKPADAPPAAEVGKEAVSADAPKGNEGDKPAGDKPAEKVETPVTGAPEEYELKLKEKGSKLQDADVVEVAAAAKALGLTQEQAQKMLESRESAADQFHDRQQQAYRDQQDTWKKEAETDQEIAGKDGKMFKENIERAHRALDRFADENFKKVLQETGLGNNPHLIRTFLRIGKGMAEDRAVLDGKQAPVTKGKSREQKLYPTHFKENKE